MGVVGEQFRTHQIFLPEVLLAARAMYAGLDLLKPLLLRDNIPMLDKVVIGTIRGDLHDIGKNLVAMMWKGANIAVVDLGTDVSAERFVEAIRDHGASIVGISALLTTTMIGMRDTVAAIRATDVGKVKVIVGGAPVTATFAASIGADGYALDAASAVTVAKQTVGMI